MRSKRKREAWPGVCWSVIGWSEARKAEVSEWKSLLEADGGKRGLDKLDEFLESRFWGPFCRF